MVKELEEEVVSTSALQDTILQSARKEQLELVALPFFRLRGFCVEEYGNC